MVFSRILPACLLGVSFAPTVHAADYVTIRHDVTVARSADRVWARIGGYCAIAEWMKVTCDYASGSGDVGTVRRLRDATTIEPMVAKTTHSYTYVQTVGAMVATNFHGTLAVEPDGTTRSRLSYTLFYDQGALPSDAVRRSEHARLDKRFQELLGVMKNLAEGK
ncbi:SRPBCC family protein [Sphingomonas crusticola]|uniref:SRPBCC family protein n=1 Tax=Sphingomonas crusticola TaxID=1697973 RepID=UPI000E2351A1|nr:SRPBCC family protein [Sphingomonas crusticola]